MRENLILLGLAAVAYLLFGRKTAVVEIGEVQMVAPPNPSIPEPFFKPQGFVGWEAVNAPQYVSLPKEPNMLFAVTAQI